MLGWMLLCVSVVIGHVRASFDNTEDDFLETSNAQGMTGHSLAVSTHPTTHPSTQCPSDRSIASREVHHPLVLTLIDPQIDLWRERWSIQD